MPNEERVEVLVVEDSPTQAEQLSHILERRGFEVVHARDGAAALELLRQHKPTLVISDIMMPGMDGYMLCRRVRDDDTLKDLPVILLTTLSDPEDVVRGLECGADNFITKPYEEEYLLSRIQFILAHQHLRRHEQTDIGVEVFFAGRKHSINANRLQILNLLLSTYETAVRKNHELERIREQLRALNEDLEQRVALRTAELARKNEELIATSGQLMQSAKLATMGELAASIAHELNNPMATVSLRVEALQESFAEGTPQRHSLDIVSSEVGRMANLVASLLQLSRRQQPQISTIDVAEEIDGTLELVDYRLRNHRVELVKEYAGVPPVHADRQQLRQLFLNLFTNAIDAMRDIEEGRARRLTIRVSSADTETGGHGDGETTTDPRVIASPCPRIVVAVQDTGTGISPENLPRIMEPFFTTKPEGQGTGLGMAICQRIVQEHGGDLAVESELGTGTTVRVTLPVTRQWMKGRALEE